MGAKETIHALEMVRRIRDEFARQAAKKSAAEVVAFYRGLGEQARRIAAKRRPPPARRASRGQGP